MGQITLILRFPDLITCQIDISDFLRKASTKVDKELYYARVRTQEQTKGNYPSCESQIEELERFSHRQSQGQGWLAQESVKDEGVSRWANLP